MKSKKISPQFWFCLNSNIVKHNVWWAINNPGYGIKPSSDFTADEIKMLCDAHIKDKCGFCNEK